MLQRLTAVFGLGALLASGAGPAAAAVAPSPSASPLKTISRQHVSPLCTALTRSIRPAVGKILESDRVIATSKPLFHDLVRASSQSDSKPAEDMDVMRLEQLVTPLVANTQKVDELLSNPYVFPKVARSSDDKQLLKMRAQLQAVNEQQKHALDIISGFVATQQLGELQAAGHEMDAATAPNTKSQMPTPGPLYPTPQTPSILNAGVDTNDISRQNDPRFKATGSVLGSNPMNAFGNAITQYQQQIQASEQAAAKSVVEAVPLCGGQVPRQQAPEPAPSPSP